MLQLKNIKNDGRTLSASFLPEGATKAGFIRLDIESGEVLEEKPSDAYGRIHAINELRWWAKNNPVNIPSEKTVMWY
jgi:hypothetical protein